MYSCIIIIHVILASISDKKYFIVSSFYFTMYLAKAYSTYMNYYDTWIHLFFYTFCFSGGKSKVVRAVGHQLEHGDVIGCCLDLSVPQLSFTLNGIKIRGIFKDFNLDSEECMFFKIMGRTSYISMRKYLLCTRPTRLAGFLYC
jgi:hypothetical protein